MAYHSWDLSKLVTDASDSVDCSLLHGFFEEGKRTYIEYVYIFEMEQLKIF